jgi:hypothetical protein
MRDKILHLLLIYDNLNLLQFNHFIQKCKNIEKVQLHIIEFLNPSCQSKLILSNQDKHYKIIADNLSNYHSILNHIIQTELPKDWDSIAYCDYKIQFKNMNWVETALSLLEKVDLVQLFSICSYQDHKNMPLTYSKGIVYAISEFESYYGECGYGWACSKKGYLKIQNDFHLLISAYNPILLDLNEIETVDNKVERQKLKHLLEKTMHLKYSYIDQIIYLKQKK